jgi:hypothetical protein
MTAESYWPCASWCERGNEPERGTCVAHLGPAYPAPVRVTLAQRHYIPWPGYGDRPAPDVALHLDERLVPMEIPAAAEMAHVLRTLGHDELAGAVQTAVELSGAVLTERDGRQRWELPA